MGRGPTLDAVQREVIEHALREFRLAGVALDAARKARFKAVIGAVIAKSSNVWTGALVRAYGEMVDLLWRDGNPEAAIRVEELWNDLAQSHVFSLLCAYPMGNFLKESHSAGFDAVCRQSLPTLASWTGSTRSRRS